MVRLEHKQAPSFSARVLTSPQHCPQNTGVITLASGLQYKVLRAGDGKEHPLVGTPCSCHYEGRSAKDYPSGPKFDSSYDRGSPSTFAPNQVIKGWTEAMQLSKLFGRCFFNRIKLTHHL